ncbi:MAG: hypothetical protein KJ674_01915 [Nanoarchaeota archaeon]|nr:hypothetical protein [Nanoarchaeota archaeon]
MVSIRWCLKQKNGLELVEPNENMSNSYLKMAQESIGVLNKVDKSSIWTATTSYYIFYYSLYSLMLRVGVKCEIHSCSIEFMKRFLNDFYDNKDIEMIEKAFSARINLQYYADRSVDKLIINECKKYCKEFFIKTKDILSKIKEIEINNIRFRLKEMSYI